MKRIFFTLCLMLCSICLMAQNGVYTVINQNELATAAVKQSLRSSMTVSYTEDAKSTRRRR